MMRVVYASKKHRYGTIRIKGDELYVYAFRDGATEEQNITRFRRCIQYILHHFKNGETVLEFYHHPLFSENIPKEYDWLTIRKLTHKNCTILEYINNVMMTGWWSKFFRSITKNNDVTSQLKNLQKVIEKNTVYPKLDHVFNAFILTSLPKVIIIGQDPYHNKGAAMGLAFGHKPEYPTIQPSLRNIYKELSACGYTTGENGDLSKWTKQGVFLINTALTVNEGEPESHLQYWRPFIRTLFSYLSRECDNLIVVMWGKKAQDFSSIFSHKHHLIKSGHPSPFSAKYFLGSEPFKKINQQLKINGCEQIDWNL